MGGKTLTILLKERVKNLSVKERQKEKHIADLRRRQQGRAWFGINNPVTKRYRRRKF